jgi:hypothetical protein
MGQLPDSLEQLDLLLLTVPKTRQGIPREFTTKSRGVIIANDWKTPT